MARRRLPVQETHPPPSLDDPQTDSTISTVSRICFSNPQIDHEVSKYPPGLRFVPDDKEVILHYLKPFIHGKPLPQMDELHHVNIYKYNPEELAAEFKKGNKKEWFFITERTKKYEGGERPDCIAKGGYWKATGGEKKIKAGGLVVGSKRSLDFRTGKQPNGVKTDWIMKEYRLDHHPLPHNKSHGDDKMLDAVLCKIYMMTPMEKKRKAEEEEEKEEEDQSKIQPSKKTRNHLPRPSPFDELSWIFYPPQPNTSKTYF